ncbi:NADPH-dependent F420 reductase [Thermomonospora amylolytica]|uniref:NADPH-dependent F420 reductase n=1 Tax=Thermomonospora amylolytica TaxID=1411117 RepID=UPI000E6BE3AC|nr:NAD(P)-binding domain-containing protein [Thermomonospora amylolytica]
MRIGVIGAGAMAEALGSGWAKAGHEVMIGGRSADRAAELAARIGAASGDLRQAAAFGEATLVAVRGDAVLDALRRAGAADGSLAGRPLIDCNVPFVPDAFSNAPDSFTLAVDALAEQIAHVAVGAHVVKAFNLCAAELWRSGPREFEGRAHAVPLCGDDPQALATVAALVEDLGLRPMNSGGLARARYLEAMAVFVIGQWFAGHDARAALPPLESAYAVPDDGD